MPAAGEARHLREQPGQLFAEPVQQHRVVRKGQRQKGQVRGHLKQVRGATVAKGELARRQLGQLGLVAAAHRLPPLGDAGADAEPVRANLADEGGEPHPQLGLLSHVSQQGLG